MGIPQPQLILALSILATSCAPEPVTAQSPYPCDPASTVTNVSISPKIPCDFPTGVTPDATTLARFAWNTFIAMSWPAQSPFTPPYERGVPNTNAPYGYTLPTIVWNTWREKRELYQIRKLDGAFKYVAPPSWNDGQPPSSTGPNPQIPACDENAKPPPGYISTLQNNKIENYLDETDEIGLAILWRDTTALPSEESLVRYQVKFSYDYFHHVRTNSWWNREMLEQAIAASPNGFSVTLPSGDNPTAQTGTILVKTAWMRLDTADDASRFFTVPAIFYKEKDEEPCYDYGQFGLIAIHIIRKTTTFPYYFFSTFEHSDNFPNAFTYANTNGQLGGQFSSTLANPFGIPYRNPQSPSPNASSSQSPPYAATRLIQPSAGVAQANADASVANEGRVWANYRLVGIQYKPLDKPDDTPGNYYMEGSPLPGPGYYPRYYQDQDFYLANPVVETNQRFQFFEGQFGQTNVANLSLYKDNDPTKPRVGSVNMGGCMGCHGVAQTKGTDFSFTLSGPLDEPEMYSAESLKEKCTDIGAAYNTSTETCVYPTAENTNSDATTVTVGCGNQRELQGCSAACPSGPNWLETVAPSLTGNSCVVGCSGRSQTGIAVCTAIGAKLVSYQNTGDGDSATISCEPGQRLVSCGGTCPASSSWLTSIRPAPAACVVSCTGSSQTAYAFCTKDPGQSTVEQNTASGASVTASCSIGKQLLFCGGGCASSSAKLTAVAGSPVSNGCVVSCSDGPQTAYALCGG